MSTYPDLHIEQPRPDQAEALSRLALRSKGHSGYDDDFLESCRAELTYTAADCSSGDLAVAYVGD